MSSPYHLRIYRYGADTEMIRFGCGSGMNPSGAISAELWFLDKEVAKYSENDRTDLHNGNLDSVNGTTVVIVTHSEENTREAGCIFRMMDRYIPAGSKSAGK